MDTSGGWRPLQPPTRRRRDDGAVGLALSASPFVRLARTHAASVAGDTCTTVALAGTLFFDISPEAARSKVALSLVLTMAPFAIVAPLLGPFIDRRRTGRRRMVLAAAAGRAVVAMVAAEAVHSVALFPLVFVLLVLGKAHAVAKASLVQATVGDDADLVLGNSRLAVLAALAGFAAAVPAGLVLKAPFLGPGWTLRLAAVAFGTAAVLSVLLDDVGEGSGEGGEGVGPGATDAPMVDGGGARLAPGILQAATAMAVLRGLVGFLTFEVSFAFRRAGVGTGWLGLVVVAGALGGFSGSFLAPNLRRAAREEVLVLVALVAMAFGGLWAWHAPGRLSAAGVGFLLGVSAATARLAFDALVQRDMPAAAQGRTFARFEAAFQVVWVVGALLPVLVALDLGWGGFVVMAAASGGAGIYAVELWALRQADAAPAVTASVPAVWPTPPVEPDGPVRRAPVRTVGPDDAVTTELSDLGASATPVSGPVETTHDSAPTTDLLVAPTVEVPRPRDAARVADDVPEGEATSP